MHENLARGSYEGLEADLPKIDHAPVAAPAQELAEQHRTTENPNEVVRDGGEHVVTDDLEALIAALPDHIIRPIREYNDRVNLLEVVMDLGRVPEARYRNKERTLSPSEVSRADLDYVTGRIGEFGGDNRAGIERTLHRISCIRNRRGEVVGLTCRIGRAVYGTISIIKDLVETGQSILMVGPPGVGKTTLLRECARVLSDEVRKRVVIVDTSNEIAGDGDIPHPSIGRARRMQVPLPERQHAVMIEAVENHMPEVIIIDEIGTELEAQAARTIAERGVQLVGTAHGTSLENLMLNPTLSDLVGGIQTVTLGDEEARRRGTQKSILERKAPPTFDIMVEILDRERVAVYRDVAEMVDALLRGDTLPPEIRTRKADGSIHTEIAHIAPNRERAGSPSMRREQQQTRGGRYNERGYGPHGSFDQAPPNAPRRQMQGGQQSGAMRGERLTGRNFQDGGGGGRNRPFEGGRVDTGNATPSNAGFGAPTASTQPAAYDENDLVDVRQEEGRGEGSPDGNREAAREASRTTRIGASASSNKPLRIYPFGVSRNRLEQAIKDLRVPSTMVRDVDNADIVMTLKNYYRKSPQMLRQAEQDGVPVFVLKSNTLSQIQQAIASVFDVSVPADPVTVALEETEDAITQVMESDRPVDLTPQSAPIRKLQHQLAERYNLGSISRGKEPFRRVRIFRQD
ncbi:MAG: AAA family ATPase [Chloroflexota bacterium]|nr:AAA family ATPase [Chloroflexota bacterium]MDQ5866159.1 AAA family ATPase [Chloroflexota bacterium]